MEIYRANPTQYVEHLPHGWYGIQTERTPSKKISLAANIARSLIATHRSPTAEYIWNLMLKRMTKTAIHGNR